MVGRLVVGLSGASGAIYGIRLLQTLAASSDVETHLVVSDSARRTILHETSYRIEDVLALATRVYDHGDVGAAIASGSFKTMGMVIAPCSIKTLSSIANSYTDNLIARAADVTLKEGRKLVLLTRETPLHLNHLRLMVRLAEVGAIILPPMPAFYHRPQTIDDLVDQIVGRSLDQLGISHSLTKEWQGVDREQGAG